MGPEGILLHYFICLLDTMFGLEVILLDLMGSRPYQVLGQVLHYLLSGNTGDDDQITLVNMLV